LSPDGVVTPDVAAKLPGRGAWVRADRAIIDQAGKKGAFARAFKAQAQVPDGWRTWWKRCCHAAVLISSVWPSVPEHLLSARQKSAPQSARIPPFCSSKQQMAPRRVAKS